MWGRLRLGLPWAALVVSCAVEAPVDNPNTTVQPAPPGSDPPVGTLGTPGVFTDRAGRLYALIESSAGTTSVAVLTVRDASIAGVHALGALEEAGFAVDIRDGLTLEIALPARFSCSTMIPGARGRSRHPRRGRSPHGLTSTGARVSRS